MGDLKRFLQTNGPVLFFVLAGVMFILAAFCPIADVLGKAKVNGFNLVFKVKGLDGLGFTRVMALLMIVAPLIAGALGFAKKGSEAIKFTFVGFGASLIVGVVYCLSLPQGVNVAWGANLYIVLAIISTGAFFLAKGE